MSRVYRTTGAVIAALLLAACSGDPAPGADPAAEPAPASPTAPATSGGEAPSEAEASSSPPAAPAGEPAEGSGADADPPDTTTVDVSMRHPNGTVLTVDTVTYTDTTIEIEMEVRNGHTEEVQLPIGGHQGNRLRLVDDQGHTYNFVVPTGEGDNVEVAPGEAVSGTFVFLGPLADGAGSVSLVWGVREPGDYSLDGEPAGTIFPGFVVRDLPVG